MKKQITKQFEITASPAVMGRIERFFALLHHNSNFGHSATFAMPLDGDGSDKVEISPKPKFAQEVNLIGGVGGLIEIAYDNSYGCCDVKHLSGDWTVKAVPTLIKNGELHKTILKSPDVQKEKS